MSSSLGGDSEWVWRIFRLGCVVCFVDQNLEFSLEKLSVSNLGFARGALGCSGLVFLLPPG